MNLREKLRAKIPTREQIHNNRWLAWLLPWLGNPKLWHWSRRGVAMGVALGVFFGLLIPIAQIPLSAGAAIVLRANVPAAAASTLVTNPITFGPIYYAAYQLGSFVTGERGGATKLPVDGSDIGLWSRIAAVGKPLFVGLLITAVLMGFTIYGFISLIWRWRVMAKRRAKRSINLGRKNG